MSESNKDENINKEDNKPSTVEKPEEQNIEHSIEENQSSVTRAPPI